MYLTLLEWYIAKILNWKKTAGPRLPRSGENSSITRSYYRIPIET